MIRRLCLILALLTVAGPVSAQVTLDSTVHDVTGGATSLTTAFTMSAALNGCLVVGTNGDATTDNITGVTYNGVAMTLQGKHNAAPGSVYWQYMWTLAAPASGANNIVVTANASIHIETLAASYTGVSATKCPEASGYTTSATDPFTVSLTTLTNGARVVEVYSGSSALTDSTGFTTRVNDSNGGFMILGDSGNISVAGSVSLSLTGNGTKEGAVVSLGPPVTAGRQSLLFGVFD